jgi:hypothetical protein
VLRTSASIRQRYIPHARVYHVPLPQTEFGLRISGSGLRAGVCRQVLDLTVGIGLDRSIFVPPIDYGTCTGTCVHIDSYERCVCHLPGYARLRAAAGPACIGEYVTWHRATRAQWRSPDSANRLPARALRVRPSREQVIIFSNCEFFIRPS